MRTLSGFGVTLLLDGDFYASTDILYSVADLGRLALFTLVLLGLGTWARRYPNMLR